MKMVAICTVMVAICTVGMYIFTIYIYIYIMCTDLWGGYPLRGEGSLNDIFDPCRYTRSVVCWNGFRFP